jgi:HK97 gp10 family phage protein
MANTGMELQGMEQLLSKVNQLGKKGNRIENKALRAGGEIVRKEISDRAPRSDTPRQPSPGSQSWRTGEHAADNIEMSRVKTKDGMKIVEVGISRGDNSHYFYLKFHEYGTSKMAAQPFMYPATVESKTEVVEKMKAVLRGGLGL